jgi:large subunit ribosomal protein L21
VRVGQPTIEGAKVLATVTDHVKGPKIIVFKYRPRERYRLKKGHRQNYTRLMIDEIVA